jgi:hypothetical protein
LHCSATAICSTATVIAGRKDHGLTVPELFEHAPDARPGGSPAEQARQKAHAMLQTVFEGHDPAQEWRERRQKLTWSEMTDIHLTRHAPRKRTA